MIVVEIEDDVLPASEELKIAASGEWIVQDRDLAAPDFLLAVRAGTVIGSYRVLNSIETSDQRIWFVLQESSRFAFLIGRPSPVAYAGRSRRAHHVDTYLLSWPGARTDELSIARTRRILGVTGACAGVPGQSRDGDRPRVAGEWVVLPTR